MENPRLVYISHLVNVGSINCFQQVNADRFDDLGQLEDDVVVELRRSHALAVRNPLGRKLKSSHREDVSRVEVALVGFTQGGPEAPDF